MDTLHILKPGQTGKRYRVGVFFYPFERRMAARWSALCAPNYSREWSSLIAEFEVFAESARTAKRAAILEMRKRRGK